MYTLITIYIYICIYVYIYILEVWRRGVCFHRAAEGAEAARHVGEGKDTGQHMCVCVCVRVCIYVHAYIYIYIGGAAAICIALRRAFRRLGMSARGRI